MKKTLLYLAIYVISITTAFASLQYHQKSPAHRENGWYRIIDGAKDSISSQPIVTAKDFVWLRIEKDFFGNSVISGSVSKHKLQAWTDSTEQLIGKRMGFVFNDSVITAPQVNMRIEIPD